MLWIKEHRTISHSAEGLFTVGLKQWWSSSHLFGQHSCHTIAMVAQLQDKSNIMAIGPLPWYFVILFTKYHMDGLLDSKQGKTVLEKKKDNRKKAIDFGLEWEQTRLLNIMIHVLITEWLATLPHSDKIGNKKQDSTVIWSNYPIQL